MPTFTTSDSCVLAYEDTGAHAEDGTQLPVLLLLHGWSGSRRYFSRNVPLMQPHLRVICLDLRFHGESQGTAYGMHIARLAVDVHEFITVGLKLSAPVTLLGTSMGCAVIWSLFELFGTSLARQAIFVDQVPLQNRRDDWALHSYGCYDEASLQALETTLTSNLASVAQGNLASCLVRPNDVPPAVLDHLAGDVLRCNPTALATLMRDHTQIDWRSLLPTITIPCLNIVGGPQNKVFPMDGALHVGRLLPHCVNVVFESCGHWLYLEQPDEFSALVTSFVRTGNVARTFLDDAQKPNAAIYVVDK
ncbi:hypothetical protein DYB37_001086 [Aphanomyces astaci]|nr:hypothetical protein DYB25_009416 [Aphanomyces astaci]RHY15843.1 hypothetical protein DYB36_005799 [Aphanomyces astaci]RHY47519.1 hypothetical protein DYB34_010116 [Aphanomyces astaci]RHY48551.1 hypothetical protein DYB38_009985 [Aphanomyces astaci]RHY75893.1 hypothetical protein DYB30_006428 [Aphanomyces astaci]